MSLSQCCGFFTIYRRAPLPSRMLRSFLMFRESNTCLFFQHLLTVKMR